jgi:hypothetical protein
MDFVWFFKEYLKNFGQELVIISIAIQVFMILKVIAKLIFLYNIWLLFRRKISSSALE